MNVESVCLLLSSVAVAGVSQILLKKGAAKKHDTFLQEYLNAPVIIGYSLMVVSTLLCIMAYRGLEYKNGPVLEATGYIFVMVLSALFLNEKITKKKVLGNVIILLGIVVFYLF